MIQQSKRTDIGVSWRRPFAKQAGIIEQFHRSLRMRLVSDSYIGWTRETLRSEHNRKGYGCREGIVQGAVP